MTGEKWGGVRSWARLLSSYELRYMLFLRKRQRISKGIRRKWYVIRQIEWNRKYGLDIQTNNIGKGLYIGHAHNINVNPSASIGDNCNLSKE